MTREITQKRSVYWRYALVAELTLVAVQNGAMAAGDHYVVASNAVAVLCGLALLVRRSHWLIAPVLTAGATGVWGWPTLPLLLVALFDLAAQRRIAVAVACAVAALGANALTHSALSLSQPQKYGSSLFMVLAVLGGLWIGNRRRLVTALNAQVEHLRIERELREQAARIAERSAIATEMHDVLAHRLSLIALHTGVLSTRKDTLPGPVTERLTLLRTASTEALADLRDVLGALRDPDADTPTAPAPVLPDVEELIEQARTAGQQVEMATDGRADQAPATHRLAVVRLVQEALTNARKHAGGAPVRIRVDYGPPATVLEVINARGTPTADPVVSGFGLVGLRERVAALGGTLHAGPNGAGTWRLAARIPHPALADQNGTRP